VRCRWDSCSAKISTRAFFGYAAGFRLDSGAFRALAALGEHALHGLEKTPAQDQIEKKNDNDRGDSRQEQRTELVNDFH